MRSVRRFASIIGFFIASSAQAQYEKYLVPDDQQDFWFLIGLVVIGWIAISTIFDKIRNK